MAGNKVEIVLDAKNWGNEADFYSSYCKATKAPEWFGRNLSALADSFQGGICRITPEKIVVRNFKPETKMSLGEEFWADIVEICQEVEVELVVHSD